MKIIKKIMLAIMCVAATIVMVSCKSKEIEAQKEKSNLQKDKSVVAELYNIIRKNTEVGYNESFINPEGAEISDKGEFRIADLFDKTIDSKSLNKVIDELGTDIWVFVSNGFKGGNIKIIKDNDIILQVDTETIDFYMDWSGYTDGLFYSENAENKKDENQTTTEPVEEETTTEVPTTEKKKIVLNPFDGIKIDYMGASPFLKVNVDTSMCGEAEQNYINYEFEDKYYKLGDKVVVKAVINDKAKTEECEYIVSPYEKEYIVSDAAEWLTVIGDTDMTEINQEVEDALAANAVISEDKNWFGGVYIGDYPVDISSVKSVEVKNRYLATLKPNRYEEYDKSYKKNFNYYITIYDIEVEMTDSSTRNMNCSVFMTNIKKDTDGKLRWDVGYEFECKHNDYEQLLSEVVIQKRDKYNVAELDIE